MTETNGYKSQVATRNNTGLHEEIDKKPSKHNIQSKDTNARYQEQLQRKISRRRRQMQEMQPRNRNTRTYTRKMPKCTPHTKHQDSNKRGNLPK